MGLHQVDLSWTPNVEPDVAHYNIYRDGVLLDSVDTPMLHYTDTTIPDAQLDVSYTLTAVDKSGNESPQSAPAVKVFSPPPLNKFTVVQSANKLTISWNKADYASVTAPRTTSKSVSTITITGM